MDKRITIIGIAGILLILFLSGGVIFLLWERNVKAGEIADAAARTAAEQANLLRQNELNLARELLASGDFDRALEILDRFLAEHSGDAEALALREQILREQQLAALNAEPGPEETEARLAAERRAEEERLFREAEAARRRAEQEELARASKELQAQMRAVNDLVSQGKLLLEKDDLAGAGRIFAEARSRMPPGEGRFESQKIADMADAYYGFSSRHGDTAEGDEAVKQAAALATEAIAKDPAQALPHYTLGKISRDRREWDKAIAEFKEAARLDPASYVYPFDLGRGYFSAKRYVDARGAFENTVKLNPKFEQGWYNLGGTLRILNRQDEALAAYHKAIGVKPDYALAHREVGRILLAKGDAKSAVEAFAAALKYSPNDIASLRELGAAQNEAGNYAAAESSFARALQSASADGQTNYNMAVVKLALRKNTEALDFAKRAVDSNPSSAVYVYTLGLAHESAGNAEVAEAAYQKAISLDSKYMRPRINLGSLYLSQGNIEEALRCLNDAFAVEPANFEVNNNLGAVYAKMENWTSSVEHYEQALAKEPNHPTVHLNLARAYTGAGNLSKAQNSYQAVLRLAPENWDALFELGKICVSLGQSNEAKKYLQDLLSRNAAYTGKADAERILAGL
jgi:tetratricopeptide (TPR) repeat protein